MHKIISTILILLIGTLFVKAQKKDFRTWYNLELEGELFNLVDFAISPEVRLWDNSTRVQSILIKNTASVPLTKFFRLGLRYRYETDIVRDYYTKYIHRGTVFAEFDYRIQRLRLSYRAKYLHEYTNIKRSENGKTPEIQHRHRIGFRYRGKGWDIVPNVAAEMIFTIRPKWMSYQQALRLTAGFQYRLTKDININLRYRYQQEYYENNPLTSHIIITGIEYEL